MERQVMEGHMSKRTPQERQADALEQMVETLDGVTKALGEIKTKLSSLTTAVRRKSRS